jgi:hypothetical protein
MVKKQAENGPKYTNSTTENPCMELQKIRKIAPQEIRLSTWLAQPFVS